MPRSFCIRTLWLFMALVSAGCGTPMAVRSLSGEQLKIIQSYQETQVKYFGIIERFVDQQIQATEALIKAESAKIQANLTKRAALQLQAPGADAAGVLSRLITDVQENNDADQAQMRGLLQLLYTLRQKHREMTDAYATIVRAQAQLDEYIQMQKADEVFVSQLLTTVGIQKEKIATTFDSIATIFHDIHESSPKGGAE